MPDQNSSPNRPSADGSHPIGQDRKRRRGGLLWLLLAGVIGVVVIGLLLSQCGGADSGTTAQNGTTDGAATTGAASRTTSSDASSSSGPSASDTDNSAGTASSNATATASGSPTGGPAGGPATGAPGSLVSADGQSVLELAAGTDPATALATVSGQDVTGTAVQVLSVPADEGFWVGNSEQDRVWIQLTGDSESPYTVTAGDLVNLTGTVTAHGPDFANAVGLAPADGAEQLTTQAQHIEAPQESVSLSR